jgi:hypothetical protein
VNPRRQRLERQSRLLHQQGLRRSHRTEYWRTPHWGPSHSPDRLRQLIRPTLPVEGSGLFPRRGNRLAAPCFR